MIRFIPVFHSTTLGVPLLPKLSTAFTENVCFPSGKLGVLYTPLVPVPQSTLRSFNVHSNVASSLDVQVIICRGLLDSRGISLVIDRTGPCVSKIYRKDLNMSVFYHSDKSSKITVFRGRARQDTTSLISLVSKKSMEKCSYYGR